MDILGKIVEHIEKDNPYGLIFKGGTALSMIYLNHHRESEDLDFDVDIKYLHDFKGIQQYFICIFNKLKKQGDVEDYKLGKTGLATTNRFHMKVQFMMYKRFQTKIDIDFIEPPVKLNHQGELLIYSVERLFISKIIAFTDRSDFKDFIDISYMLPKIDFNIYENKNELAKILQKLIDSTNEERLVLRFNSIIQNVDLKIRDFRKSDLTNLVTKTLRGLRSAINVLKR